MALGNITRLIGYYKNLLFWLKKTANKILDHLYHINLFSIFRY